MIYRRGKGVACLNFEVARIPADIYNRGSDLDQVDVQKFLFNLLGLDVKPEINIEKLEEGISFDVVESETRRAMIMVEASKLVPSYFWTIPSSAKALVAP